MAKYILKRDNARKFYWILKSDKNNKIIAMSSEAYESKQGANEAIAWTRVNAKDASYEDLT